MPNLLFLTQRIPYPPIKGEKIRPLQILRHLCKSYDVHLGCLVDDPADEEHVPTVAALCATSHFARLDRSRAKLLCLTGLLTGEALSVTFYRDRGLAAWVTPDALRDVRPEAIFICSSNMAPYVLGQHEAGARRACATSPTSIPRSGGPMPRRGGGPMRLVHASRVAEGGARWRRRSRAKFDW